MQTRRPAQRQPEPHRGGDPASGSRATCAAAPATTTSSGPCSTPPSQQSATPRGRTHDRHRGRPAPAARRSARDRRRKEDQRLITGRTRWTDNITLPGMLHLAMVRSPFAHAKITAIDTEAAKAAPNVVAVLTGADFGDEQGVLHQRLADHARPGDARRTRRCAVDRVAFAGEIVAVVVARTRRRGPRRRRARRRRLRGAARRARPQGGRGRTRCSRTPTSAPTSRRSGSSTPREAGTGGNVEEAIAKARTDGIVIEREYRQQRLIPAFMEPRSVVVDPTGEQITMWSATQIPHILRFALAATTGVPESKIRVIAPDVGGGFGGKLQVTPEEWIAWAVGPPARQAGEVHRDPLRVADGGPPRPRPVAEADPGRREGRHGHRAQGRAARRPRRLRRARRRRRAGARRVHVQRDLQVPGLPLRLPDRAHQQDLDRRLPRRRPARGDVRHRAADGRARRRARRRPARDPGEELDQARGVPVHHGRRAGVRLRQLRGRHRARPRRCSGTTSCGPSRSGAASRDDPVQLGIGVSTFTEMCGLAPSPGARAASTTAPAAGSTRACGCWPPARSRWSPAPAPTGRATRRRSARSWPTGSACRSRTSRCCTATPRSPHKGLDTYGSRSLVVGGEALVKAADKVIEKAKPIAAHLLEASRRRHRVHGRPVLGPGHRPGRRRSPRSRWRPSPRTTCPTGSSRRSTPTRRTTR